VACHDTASAFAAAPLVGAHSAVLSSGTWSLLGVELDDPQLGPDAAAYNLTNERGVCGTVRLLRNVMGLWLVQECRRAWTAAGDAPAPAAPRASIETLLHAFIPAAHVHHTHPDAINALACARDGQELIAECFGDSAAWIE
jgi:rhamnulokinase